MTLPKTSKPQIKKKPKPTEKLQKDQNPPNQRLYREKPKLPKILHHFLIIHREGINTGLYSVSYESRAVLIEVVGGYI